MPSERVIASVLAWNVATQRFVATQIMNRATATASRTAAIRRVITIPASRSLVPSTDMDMLGTDMDMLSMPSYSLAGRLEQPLGTTSWNLGTRLRPPHVHPL